MTPQKWIGAVDGVGGVGGGGAAYRRRIAVAAHRLRAGIDDGSDVGAQDLHRELVLVVLRLRVTLGARR